MKFEKPYNKVKPTDTTIDYSHCYLPFFESKREGWLYYKDKIVSIEESFKLREMGFSEPTHMTWYLDSYFYQLNPKNHNDSPLKISLPTREQADCFLNGR